MRITGGGGGVGGVREGLLSWSQDLFCFINEFIWLLLFFPWVYLHLITNSGVEAGKKAAGEVLALQKRVLAVLNEAR